MVAMEGGKNAMTFKSLFYDFVVSKYYDDEVAEATADSRRRCVELLSIESGDIVLDLGCGSGLNQPFIAEAVGAEGRIIGLDASSAMLDLAEDRAREQGYRDKLKLIQGDARKMSELISESPDKVMTTLFFSVVPDWQSVFSASYRLLNAGGRYLVMDTFWEKPNLAARFLITRYAAKAAVPGFKPLEESCEDYYFENFPPDIEPGFYIAVGRKPLEN